MAVPVCYPLYPWSGTITESCLGSRHNESLSLEQLLGHALPMIGQCFHDWGSHTHAVPVWAKTHNLIDACHLMMAAAADCLPQANQVSQTVPPLHDRLEAHLQLSCKTDHHNAKHSPITQGRDPSSQWHAIFDLAQKQMQLQITSL